MSLKKELQNRLSQLEQRKFMLPRYCDNNYTFLGIKVYSLNMLPGIQKQIDETKAALKGICDWEAKSKKENDANKVEQKSTGSI